MNLPQIDISDLPPVEAPNFDPKELADFIATKRVMIVDTSAYVTQALQRLLTQLGARPTEVFVYRSFAAAAQGILARKPHLLITALQLDTQSGLDLVKLQERQFVNRLEVASLLLVTDAASMSAGLIADANVDAVLVKPMNQNSAKEGIYQALANKVKPSPYWSRLERAKEHLGRIELEDAMRLFEEAKRYDPKPTLSFYYQGLIQHQKKRFEEALDFFVGGLAFDPKDYRCLSAALDVRMEREEFNEAYDIVQSIHENYPVNSGRLLELLKLSITVGKFDDIPTYHQVFVNSEENTPEVARGMIAAMLVSAKAYAWKEDRDQSLQLLRSAGRLSMKHQLLREESLRYFIETKHFEQALSFYSDLPATLKEDPKFQLLSLEAIHELGNSADVIRMGMQLLKMGTVQGPVPARAYEIVLEHSRRLGRPDTVIERIVTEAAGYYPNRIW